MKRIIAYLKNLLIALDQLLGALFLGNEADMTISAQAWLWHLQGKRDWAYKLIDRLLFWDRNHCAESFRSEKERRQVPPELR